MWIWNGSPESFFHPRDVDWEAIASSLGGIRGHFDIFYGEDRSVPKPLRAPWALVNDLSGVKMPHSNKREAHFSVMTSGLEGFHEP